VKYADVILPLPLEGLFTYSIPDEMAGTVRTGVRVQVPLGRSKRYTAVVVDTHDRRPAFKTRDILSVLDTEPVLLPSQYKLWQWMSEYYLAPLGDIYKAALPAGLKEEDGWRPKTEVYVGLSDTYRTEAALHTALDLVRRARKQYQTLSQFLFLSHWDSLDGDTPGEEIEEITREELMNAAACSTVIVKALTDRGILYLYEKEVGRLSQPITTEPRRPHALSPAQQEAYNGIVFQFLKRPVVLLRGVTSSGKTEIYIHLIRKALEEKQQVLYLLPEIALTVQMMDRLRAVFGDRLGIYHSKYSDAERVEIWRKQLSPHPYDIILGARSAVFLPFRRLGLVIVDEEHETSFKQQDPSPRYHGRDTAIYLAHQTGAKTLLGTATPSAESYYNALQGKYGLVSLDSRYKDILLPKVEIVDVKDLRRRKMMNGAFSPRLLGAVKDALAEGGQVILFQNRRGFAPLVECPACGWVPKCVNCDVPLTYHKGRDVMTCHYCGATYPVPSECPACGEKHLRGRGYGTEKVEDRIQEIFPEARIGRMDLDTTRTKQAYERLIRDFSTGRTNLLIGTQMVTKGLDFDRVRVVGILDADTLLNYPDFRAYEYAFAMLSQVSGRAGRKGRQGLVILQTRQADLPLIRQLTGHEEKRFYEELLEERKTFRYPPFCRLITVYLRHTHDETVESAAFLLGTWLRSWFGPRVLGPDRPSVARVKTMHIRKIVLKLENGIDLKKVRAYLRQAKDELTKEARYGALQVYYDVDPV